MGAAFDAPNAAPPTAALPLTALFRLCWNLCGDGEYIFRLSHERVTSGHPGFPAKSLDFVGWKLDPMSLFRLLVFLFRCGEFFLLLFPLAQQRQDGVFHFTGRFVFSEILRKLLAGKYHLVGLLFFLH